MHIVKRVLVVAAILAATTAPAWAEGIGGDMSTFAGSGQVGSVMSEYGKAWSWGQGVRQNPDGVKNGANSDAVANYPGGPSPQGSQLPDLIIILQEEGLL